MTDAARTLGGIGALAEPVRRALYECVVASAEPLGREQAAEAVGVPLHTAKFHLDRLIATAALLVVGGFAGFSSAPSVGPAFAWLVVAGLGVAPLYPQTLTQLIGASATPDAGSRWGAVASGTAITVSPQILGRVADGVGLRWAYVLVPVLVVLLVIQQLAQHRSAHRHTAAVH